MKIQWILSMVLVLSFLVLTATIVYGSNVVVEALETMNDRINLLNSEVDLLGGKMGQQWWNRRPVPQKQRDNI